MEGATNKFLPCRENPLAREGSFTFAVGKVLRKLSTAFFFSQEG